MIPLVFAGLLLAFVVTPASAEAPVGFAEFPWGTSPAVLQQQFVSNRCRSSIESRREWYSVLCREYRVEGLSVPALRLDFEPADRLAGYHMVLARGSYRAFRELVVKRFGPPTRRAYFWAAGQEWWVWPGVSATLTENCGEEVSCLEVMTTVLERRREQIRERERRDSTQSF
jgi:hypothetical protein